MQATQTQPARSANRGTTTWAEWLAQRLGAGSASEQIDSCSHMPAAAAALWGLFDDALGEINAALDQAGLRNRIWLGQTGDERRYFTTGTDGTQRFIAISLIAPIVAESAFGGASIRASQTRSPILLAPAIDGRRVYWVIPAANEELSADVISDLFLSVFGGDPAATVRLSFLSKA